MKSSDTETHSARRQDPHLQDIALEAVLQKRSLDQALNVKEFALCAGVSYSTARAWFRLSGFPAFQGVIFWQDFVRWRMDQTGLNKPDVFVAASDLAGVLHEGGRLSPYRSRRFDRSKTKSNDEPV